MIAQLLGHSDPATTKRYVHIKNDATQALVEARWEKLGR